MSLPAIPSAQSIVPGQLREYGEAVVAWANMTDDIAEVREATNKWAAITEYVRRTTREGLADAMASLRRLEARVGDLLGPPLSRQEAGSLRGTGGLPTEEDLPSIPNAQKSDFRQMSEHGDVVDRVIASSSDRNPPTRARVMDAIKDKKDVAANGTVDRTRDGARRRIENIKHLAAEGRTSVQIADIIGITVVHVNRLARREGITIHADRLTSCYSRRLNPEAVIENTIEALDGLTLALTYIEADIPALDATKRLQWLERLREPLAAINRLKKGLSG